jgi:hypothetical protein
VTVEAPRRVRCGSCGGYFELNPRNIRGWRARGEEPRCHSCRHHREVDEATAEKMRQWWLEESGLTLDELHELADLLAS